MVFRRMFVVVSVCSFALFGAATAGGAAGNPHSAGNACTSGTIAPGNYHSLTITGVCVLGGDVSVNGGVTVAPGAVLNAITPGNLNVNGGITVGEGAILGLGCSPNIDCDVTTNDHVNGGLRATNAAAVIVHSVSINGEVAVTGGGGGVNCDPREVLEGSPLYVVVEDSTINGHASFTNLQSCWFGFFRNHVNGGVRVANNTFADPDATEIQTNVIHGSLDCSGNSPAAQQGDSEGSPNVASHKTGECAGL